MSDAKHTPGPWRAECVGKHWNNPDIDSWIVTFTDDGEQIVDHVYEAADAYLISAAPDLLASLDVMTTLCAIKYGNIDAHVFAEIKKARCAIAKARGEV